MKNRSNAHKVLPENYRLSQKVDLINEPRLLLILSLASLVLFVASWVILGWLLTVLRSDTFASNVSFSFSPGGSGSIILSLLVLLGVILTMVVLHEGIHGLFFWLFTGGKVEFAFKGAYAYAAAPDWYLSKRPYLFISLAPLVIITVLGVILLFIVPPSWISPVFLLVTFNASGAVGDIYVFYLLARMSGDQLIRDSGERMEIYTPEDTQTSL